MMQPLKKSVLPGKNVTVYNVKLVFKNYTPTKRAIAICGFLCDVHIMAMCVVEKRTSSVSASGSLT